MKPKSEMKILVFYPDSNYWGGKYVGGGATRFIEIAKRLVQDELHVVSSQFDCAFLNASGVEAAYHPYEFEGTGNVAFNLLLPVLKASEIISDLSSSLNVIYVPSELIPIMLPALVAKRKMHIPMVIVFQAGTHMYRTVSFSRIFRSYRRKCRIDATLFSTLRDRFRIEFARRCVDTSIAVNEVIAKSLEDGGFPPGRIAVNGNGVDFDFLKSIPEEEKKYDACYVSAITASKGVFDLVEVWRRILYEWKMNLRLIIIGMGSKAEIAQLKDMIVQFNLEDAIEIAGFIPDQTEVFRRIKQSKLFILPTYGESWCLAITEAMALGTPVITYDLPIFKAIYPRGIIRVPIGNLKMFERNILSALSDEEYLEKIRSEAESTVKRYDWAAVAKREREILSRVAE